MSAKALAFDTLTLFASRSASIRTYLVFTINQGNYLLDAWRKDGKDFRLTYLGYDLHFRSFSLF